MFPKPLNSMIDTWNGEGDLSKRVPLQHGMRKPSIYKSGLRSPKKRQKKRFHNQHECPRPVYVDVRLRPLSSFRIVRRFDRLGTFENLVGWSARWYFEIRALALLF